MRLIQSGNRSTKLVIVGEAPGEAEDREGLPFIGGAGTILTQMLDRAGIRRSDCFITNVCHHRPPKNDFKWFYTAEGQKHLIPGIMQLKKDLTDIQPNVVLALGANPLQIIAGKKGITDWRGSIIQSTLVPGMKVISTYHPAAIMRQWDYKAVAEFDIKRVRSEMTTPSIVYPERTLYLPNPDHTTTATVRDGLTWRDTTEPVHRSLIADEMLAAPLLSIDIECWQDASGTWKLACVGFSDRPDRALVIACNTAEDLHLIRVLCESPVRKIYQNGMFDVTVLRDNGIDPKNFYWDTMFAHHTLFAESSSGGDEMATLTGKKRSAGLAKGLAFQTSIYTKEPFYKSDGKLWKETNDLRMFYRYNALDACVTREIMGVQDAELESFGSRYVFENSYMRLVEHAMSATRHGILIDMNVRDELRKTTEAKIANLQKFIDDTNGTHLNVKSNPQMTDLLYNKLKLPMRRGKSGNPTADADTIIELGNMSSSPILHSIIALRQQRDIIERYVSTPLGPDNRMRCAFDLTGTRSGRLSSRASLDGTGTNLQNQPEDFRVVYIPRPGNVFVYRDYSQAEARIVAYLARCKGLIDLFEDPDRDVHTENAARIFGHTVAIREKLGGPVTEVQRYLAKKVVHASNYGMGPARLVEVVNKETAVTKIRMVLAGAKSLMDKYFMLYPEIQQNFWRGVEQDLRHTRTLNTTFGRKRMFFGRWDDKLLREAYSYIPQSTVGDLARIAWANIGDALNDRPELGAICLLNVHDSLLVECTEGAQETVARIMRECMSIEMEINGYKFMIPTDCKVGYNWANKSATNPNGLKEMDGW